MCSTDSDSVALGITFLAVCFSPHQRRLASLTPPALTRVRKILGKNTHATKFQYLQTYISCSDKHFWCTKTYALPRIHGRIHSCGGGQRVKCHIKAGGCTEVLWPHDASALSPNLLVLCGTSDRNRKRDVCFGARNLSLLSLGV